MNREDVLKRFHAHEGVWDVVVIGGGATGVAVAMDAAIRGLSVVLVEQSDLGKGLPVAVPSWFMVGSVICSRGTSHLSGMPCGNVRY